MFGSWPMGVTYFSKPVVIGSNNQNTTTRGKCKTSGEVVIDTALEAPKATCPGSVYQATLSLTAKTSAPRLNSRLRVRPRGKVKGFLFVQ